MKREWISILAVVILVVLISPAVATQAAPEIVPSCNWVGGATGAWTVGTNWSDCTGTGGVPAATDTVSLGSGSTITITDVPTTTIARLSISNSTTVNLQAGAAGNVLTIADGTGTDLDVLSGSALNMNGASALTILLSTGATGSISGSMTCSAAASKLNASDASAITFNSGGYFTQGASCTGNAFTNAGTTNVVVFASGSTFVSQAGSNPFGLSAPNSKVVFQSGSLYRHEQTGLPSASGRTYANFELNYATYSGNSTGGSAVSFNNLTTTSGTLNLGMTGTPGHAIKGDVTVGLGSTLNFNPASAGTFVFNGSTQQVISGAGTLTIGANQTFVLDNANGLLLQRDVAFNGPQLTLTSGNITTGANTLTLATSTLVSGAGDVVGNTKRSGPFVAGTAYSFGNPDVTLTFIDEPASRIASIDALPTEVIVNLTSGTPVGFPNAVSRAYTIAATGGSGYSATVRLHYLDSELNGNTEDNLVLWRYNGTAWESAGRSAFDTTDNWVALDGVTEFSPWALSDAAPTAVTLSAFSATPNGARNALPFAGVALLGGLAVFVRRRRA